ncbi:MAG: hypothetical protein CMJ13_05800 [Pelagibacterales bacterium]|nr:hypothetical protein [Pelagibacterales bacterium]
MNIRYKYKLYLYPLLVFFILVLVLFLLKILKSDNVSLVEEEKKIPVKTKILYPEPINQEFLFFGRITGKNEISIVSKLSGKTVFISPKLFNSDEVKKGEVLFKIDSFEFEQDLIRKKAYLDDLKIELDKTKLLLRESDKQLQLAEEDFQRKKKLFGNTVSQKALDDADLKLSKSKTQYSQQEYKVNSIKINIKDAEAMLKIAKKNLSFTNYKAPFAGKVTDNSIDLGSEIISGDSIAKLINTSELEVKFFVGEGKFTELGNNKELIGRKIKIRWKKSKFNEIYEAKLNRIDSVINEDLAGLNMYAKLSNISKDDPIRPGVFVEVIFQGKTIAEAIKVPESSVYQEKYIFVLKDNKPIRVDVNVEGYIGNELILSGEFIPGSLMILTRLDSFQSRNNYYSITD